MINRQSILEGGTKPLDKTLVAEVYKSYPSIKRLVKDHNVIEDLDE